MKIKIEWDVPFGQSLSYPSEFFNIVKKQIVSFITAEKSLLSLPLVCLFAILSAH